MSDLLKAAENCLHEAGQKDTDDTRRGVLIERARQHIEEVRDDEE